jgi:hypothetical protein
MSVFAVCCATLEEMTQVRLVRFGSLTLLKVRDVLAARLRIEATGAIRVTTPDLPYRLAAELGWLG